MGDWKSFLRPLQKIDFKRPFFEIWEEITLVNPYLVNIPFWISAVLVGVLAVIYSYAFTSAIAFSQNLLAKTPYALYLLSPICFLLATWIVEKFAPQAAGTGIPKVSLALELNCATQRPQIQSLLNVKTLAVVGISSCLCVLGAGSLGREGPMIHMAACVFYILGQYFYSFKSPEDHRAWIVAGGAAGIAAAFNAPLAGVVFVLEELAQQHFHRFRTVVISAAIIGGIISQWLSGKYLYLGYPMIGSVPISSVPWAILIGSMCGLFAIPFHKMLSPRFQEAFKKRFNTRLRLSLFIGLSIATLAIFVSSGTVGGGTTVVDGLLFKGERASWNLILGRFLATFLSHLSGCSGGFLAPALALGAAIGSKLATVFNYPNHNLIVLVGMSSFLSAIIRAPFTGWVIVMEMTDRHSAIFPLMVGSMCAHGVVKYFIDREKPAAA